MKILKVAVVGLGFIGRLHSRIFSEIPNAELVAVSDINEEFGAEISKTLSCKYFNKFSELFSTECLDAVSICVPDEYHAEVAIEAARCGIHILLEKPIAKNLDDAVKIIDSAKKHNVRLMIGQILHFDPRYSQLKQKIEVGEIGEILHMSFRRTNPLANGRRLAGKASIFHFIGVHDIDMMCTYSKYKPTKVYCQKISKLNADIQCEDSVFAIITFENGAIGNLELSWALPNNSALGINTYAEVLGDKSIAYINIMDQGLSIYNEKNIYFPDTLHWPEYNNQILGDLKEELQHFVSATLENKEYFVNTENALMAIKVIEACFESIKLDQVIYIQ